MLSDQDSKRLKELARQTPAPLEIVFCPDDGPSPYSLQLAELAGRLEDVLGQAAHSHQGDGTGLPARPALSLRQADGATINYLALPEGMETAPFVDLLAAMLSPQSDNSAETLQALAGMEQPAELMVFVASACPHCAQAVRNAGQIALACPAVSLSIIDAQRYPDLARDLGARSVPHTLVDRGLGQTGVVSVADLVEALRSREGPEYKHRSFVSMVESQRFDEAMAELLRPDGLTSFAAAWKKSAMSLRMGLMMVVEQALETDRAALDGLVDPFLPLLTADDASLRGDTADLLGQIGHPAAIDALEALRSDPNPDVAELADEALQAIAAHGQPSPE